MRKYSFLARSVSTVKPMTCCFVAHQFIDPFAPRTIRAMGAFRAENGRVLWSDIGGYSLVGIAVANLKLDF